MTTNNLGGPRIADNQVEGQHRTSNEADNWLDRAVTNPLDVVFTSNSKSLTTVQIASGFEWHLVADSPGPDDTVELTLAVSNPVKPRGGIAIFNDLGFDAIVVGSGQTGGVEIPAGGKAFISYDGVTVREIFGSGSVPFELGFAVTDEATAITTGSNKIRLRLPSAVHLTEARATLSTAQASGSTFTVDVNIGGASIFSTTLTIDNTEKTSKTAATPAVISVADHADDSEVTVDVDAIGDGTAKGLKIWLIGSRIPA